jgi:AcrR family transcriptional regulator
MPYSKEHKRQTRAKILSSAFELFTAKGFDSVTVDEVMEGCNLTRGAFYAHFPSKGALYSESLKFFASNSKLSK